MRIVASRGSMDLGESDGGLLPDAVVEELDAVLADTERLVAELHEPGPGASRRSRRCTARRLGDAAAQGGLGAALARRVGLPLHTHLAEMAEEDAYCQELYGCRQVEYLAELGWLAEDVWCAHCVHLSADDIATFGRDFQRRRRALPDLEPAPRSRRRAGPGPARRKSESASASTEARRTSAATSRSRSAGAADARGRGTPCADRARGAAARDTWGRGRCCGATTSGCWSRATRDFAVRRMDGLELGGAENSVAELGVLAPGHRSTGWSSAARRSSATVGSWAPTRSRSPASTAARRRASRRSRRRAPG